MNKKGFSLIELMIVFLILGILFGIAGISGRQWMDKYRVESQTRAMLADFSNARSRAMTRLRVHLVFIASSYYAIYEDTVPSPEGNGTLDFGDQLVMQKNLTDHVEVPDGADTIAFDTRGLMTMGLTGSQTNLRVKDSLGAAVDCIALSATRIRIGKWDGSTCVAR